MLEQRPRLMPAGHDRAALGFEQRERAAGVDDLLQDEPPAAGQGRERTEDEAAAPEERHVSPPRVVGRRRRGTRRCGAPEVVSAPCACTTAFACAVVPEVKKIVATSVGDTRALERVEEGVVDAPGEVVPALGAARAAGAACPPRAG